MPEPYAGEATIAGDGDRLFLDVAMPAADARQISAAWFFPERFGIIDNAGAQTLVGTADGIRVILPAATPGTTLAAAPAPVSGVLVIERGGERRGYDIKADIRS